jgi:hypothetical protein
VDDWSLWVRDGSRVPSRVTASTEITLTIVEGRVVSKSEQSKSEVQRHKKLAKLLSLVREGCLRTIYLGFANGFGD